jgi:predicted neuraminidase
MKRRVSPSAGALPLAAWVGACSVPASEGSTLRSQANAAAHAEFVFESAPFACHASTIAEARDGLVAAWFGGTEERAPDVGIWLARRVGESWTAPVEVASGAEASGRRYPCWNPVLFQPASGPLMLFYKVGPSPSSWWGMRSDSSDSGRTWSAPRRLPGGILGPIKNKPVELADGSILSPSSSEDAGWRIHVERSSDHCATWTRSAPLGGDEFAAIQPTVLLHPGGRVQLLCRTRQGVIAECASEDGGLSFGPLRATELPNPNSGIDALTLRDGRQLLVYNPTTKGRTPLALALSRDGVEWRTALVLEDGPGEFSYPAVVQSRDGHVHVTYTWKRERVKHVDVDPAQLDPAR